MSAPLLNISRLSVSYSGARDSDLALDHVSLKMGREKLGLIGQSGSGKSTLARAVLRLMPEGASLKAEAMNFMTTDLSALDEPSMRHLRGRKIAFIPQDCRAALNPVMRIGRQIAEGLPKGTTKAEAKARILEMLRLVHLDDPERILKAYPHELSGGMCQRAVIAMMVMGAPDLLIADEPTSALDLTVRRHVLDLFDELIKPGGVNPDGMGLLIISHDLDLVAGFCDRVMVMYGGRIVETLAAAKIENCRHPYTKGLLDCLPRFSNAGRMLPTLKPRPDWMEPVI